MGHPPLIQHARGTRTLGPYTTVGEQVFTVVCTGTDDATASASATLNVTGSSEPPTPEPTVSASLSATVVKAHVTTVDLTWNSTGTTWCERDGTALSGTSGSETGFGPFYEGSHSFTVTCGRDADTRTASATVTVRAATAVACSAHPTAPFRALRIAVGEHTHSVTGANVGTVFGDNPYTSDSPISKAAVHAGIVAVGESAIIRLTQENGQFSFSGSTRNGVTSRSLDSWRSQYTLEKVSDCGATAPSIPEAPVNLVSSENPSPDGSFSLSWDAPSGTGATPTGYLVYRSGSKSGYLSKTFADRTLSISGLSDGSYAYKVFACTGTDGDPDCGLVASITVTVEIPDNDNDGIPDATDPDDDNDGMTDVWEMENGLNSLNASDATLDADNDNHNNLAEFNAGSDPNWNLSKPGSIPVLAAGFNNSYTVQRGLVNSDQLQDLLIQDPTSGILPAVSKFVLIQQAEGGFSMESTDAHTLPSASQLTSIDQVIQLHDLNADGVTDMLLFELDEHIDGAKDQIIYANYDDLYTVPNKHVGVSDKLYKFFEQVSGWINDEDYFQDNARQVMVPELDSVSFLYNSDGDLFTGENSDETQTRTECTSDVCFDDDLECTGFTLAPIFCVVVYGDIGDIGGLGASGNPCSVVAFSCGYGTDTYDVGVEDAHDDPNQANVYAVVEVEFHDTSTIAVPDYSGFDPKALDLVTELFAPVRDAGTIVPGSVEAIEIASTLEGYLKTTIFAGGLDELGAGVFPPTQDYEFWKIIVRIILIVIEYIVNREGEEEETTTTPTNPDPDPPTNPDENCELRTDQDCPEEPVIPVTPVPEEEIDPMVSIAATTTGALKITTEPEMPTVTFDARVTGADGDGIDVSYQWYASVSYRGVGKQSTTNDSGEVVMIDEVHLFESRVPEVGTLSGTNGASSQENTWTVPWGEVLLGGNLTIYVTATISSGGEEIASVSDTETYKVIGTNPSLENIQEITENSVEKLAVSWHESCHSQFDYPGDTCRARNDMLPMYGEPDGWGIMQIDNIPGVTKSAGIFWNWRTNLQEGMNYLDTIYAEALMWLEDRYDDDDESEDGRSSGEDHDWGWSPFELDDPAVSRRIWDDVFSRYNSGGHLYYTSGNGGVPNCAASRGDKRGRTTDPGEVENPNMRFDGCDYADEVRRHINLVSWD